MEITTEIFVVLMQGDLTLGAAFIKNKFYNISSIKIESTNHLLYSYDICVHVKPNTIKNKLNITLRLPCPDSFIWYPKHALNIIILYFELQFLMAINLLNCARVCIVLYLLHSDVSSSNNFSNLYFKIHSHF